MIELKPMPAADFTAWCARSAVEYAENKVRAGNWVPEGAAERAEKELATLLPLGVDTPGHAVFVARDGGVVCGYIWLLYDEKRKYAYVYDLFVDAAKRGKGYGDAILTAGETWAAGRGATNIGLHVFGFNTVAQGLYRKRGYEITNINMAKKLPT